ncbi:MAG TPA: arginine--tRNA ligase [Terriglobales bacterium]|nr:arginine--tRNA ligase [Terriglobales bacterium]
MKTRLLERLRSVLRQQYGLEVESIVVEAPPRVELGEYALPLAFELARKLRKAPRKIAEEIVSALGQVEGFERFEVAGAGYINARLDRVAAARALLRQGELPQAPASHPAEILVEHTSINPNKAAHIGHLRNAVLGDTFVRLLRAGSHSVDVQNYIDNTGVQVADVVVGLVFAQGLSKQEILKAAESDPRFDYTCWDVYARVSPWYEQSKENAARRAEVLHAIEAGNNDLAEIAAVVSTSIVRFHLRTMQRLGIEYDFLPRESEIIHLRFWDLAFQQLKEKGVIYLEKQGAKAGCWVTRRPKPQAAAAAAGPVGSGESLAEEDTKVIVRSNGTVVYEGKDIAYHLWKFGLLGRDFAYCRFYEYPDRRTCWISAERGEVNHPHFGGAREIYNVIDSRQAEAQTTVMEALRGLGHTDAADHYHHFSYEMVALTPRCAAELGYPIAPEDMQRAYIEVSGRKGFGVKADDLLDIMIASAQKEVDSRHPELPEEERQHIAKQIAIGALRYFMLKFTRNSVIAFDFKDALSFEGETGPYAQYAVVRASNIFRKAGVSSEEVLARAVDFGDFFAGESGTEIWELWLAAAKTTYIIEQCIATEEPAYLAKHVFQVAQLFNNFYHRHHILNEPHGGRKQFLLATAAVVRRELIRTLAVLGITVPAVM